MMRSIFLVLLVCTAFANAQSVGQFLVDNIWDPFVDAVTTNLVNVLTGTLTGWLGKRGLGDFFVDNIVNPLITGITNNFVTVVTGALTGLLGKRGLGTFLVDNVWNPLVEAVTTNFVTVVTGALTGLGKRNVGTFLWDNIVDPLITGITNNFVSVVSGALTGLLGKRGVEFGPVQSIIQQIVPSFVQQVVGHLTNFIVALLPLARHVVLKEKSPSYHVGVVNALNALDNGMKLSVQQFINTVLQTVQHILSNVQLNQLVALITQVTSGFLNFSHILEPIVNMVFQVLSNPFVTNLVGQILG